MKNIASNTYDLDKLPSALRRCRETLGMAYRDVADNARCSKTDVKDWEHGRSKPTATQLQCLFSTFVSLRAILRADALSTTPSKAATVTIEETEPISDVLADMAALDDSYMPTPVPFQAVPELPKISSAKTFQEALKIARVSAGLTQEEVGELLKVHRTTAGSWEMGEFFPIQAHYVALCDLFPDLKTAPKPDSKDIEKPGFEAGNGPTASIIEAPKNVKEGENKLDSIGFRVVAGIAARDIGFVSPATRYASLLSDLAEMRRRMGEAAEAMRRSEAEYRKMYTVTLDVLQKLYDTIGVPAKATSLPVPLPSNAADSLAIAYPKEPS